LVAAPRRHTLTGALCERRNLACAFSADGTRLLAGSGTGYHFCAVQQNGRE
jgi:hypothetical protein